MKNIKQIVIGLFLASSFSLFADINIISPLVKSSDDVFANKQTLLIQADDNEEIFYSFNDDDPLETGFVYDGPVLLDVSGKIKLNVTSLKNKIRSDFCLEFTVDESISLLEKIEDIDFIKLLSKEACFDLAPGKSLEIPESFCYKFYSRDGLDQFDTAGVIKLSEKSTLERFTTLVLTDKNNTVWSFVIHSEPQDTGVFSRKEVPFQIEQWSKVKFTDRTFIYSIDDSWWRGIGEPVQIDRTVSHTVKWQSVDYQSENPVESFVIPPIPVIKAETQADNSVILSLEGDESYRISGTRNNQVNAASPGLHKSIYVDAFSGENFSALIPLDIFSDNVYQGTLYSSVQVNRRRPACPEVVIKENGSGKGVVYRNNVEFSLRADDENKIKYFIYGPVSYSQEQLVENAERKIELNTDLFSLYDNRKITLASPDDKCVLYTIACYSIDKWENTSNVLAVDVVIDKCNYYVSEGAKSNADADGTILYPYSDLTQIEKIVNSSKFARFNITGEVKLPDRKIFVKQNFEINGKLDAKLLFAKNTVFEIKNSSLEINNILIDSKKQNSDKTNLFLLNNSVLSVKNSELIMERAKNATLINAVKSVIDLKSSGFTVSANDYASVISAQDSKLTCEDSRFTTVASTNVNISVKKTKTDIHNCKMKVSGLYGRAAEFFASNAEVYSNEIRAEFLQKKNNNVALWKDENSSLVEKRPNSIEGF